MVVYPEGIWYCGLTAEAIDRIVDEHFVGGRAVEEYAREPGRHD
jgi:(2Fe-2S) ferredoxin